MPDEDRRHREPVEREGATGAALESSHEEDRREQAQGQEHRVTARLLRPLDDERAGDEKEPAEKGHAPVERHPAREHDHEHSAEHRGDDRGKPKRPLRVSGDGCPGLLDRVVEPVEAFERPRVAPGDLLRREGLVEPQRRSSELNQAEPESHRAHDHRVDRERAGANARQRTTGEVGDATRCGDPASSCIVNSATRRYCSACGFDGPCATPFVARLDRSASFAGRRGVTRGRRSADLDKRLAAPD